MTTLCFECDAIADHWHHVVPKSKGGVRTIPLCQQCHAKVHSPHLLTTCRLTKDAMQQKRLRGERTGEVPFGFRLAADGVRLERDDNESQIIKLMHLWRHDGMSYHRIASRLNADGVPPKKGTRWYSTSVWMIIRRTAQKADGAKAPGKLKQGVLF